MAVQGTERIRQAADTLLDEGVAPITITRIISDLIGADTTLAKSMVSCIVQEQTSSWLATAEVQMANYAESQSWTRLGQLLALYQKVVSK